MGADRGRQKEDLCQRRKDRWEECCNISVGLVIARLRKTKRAELNFCVKVFPDKDKCYLLARYIPDHPQDNSEKSGPVFDCFTFLLYSHKIMWQSQYFSFPLHEKAETKTASLCRTPH